MITKQDKKRSKRIKADKQRLRTLERVSDVSEAWKVFYEKLGDEDYIDNHRSCFMDDPSQIAQYEKIESDGCCGSFDMSVLIGDVEFRMGCNYGH